METPGMEAESPKGEEGLYMGYSHLTTFFAWLLGFAISGYLLDAFCPDPKTLTADVHALWQAAIETGTAMPEAYTHAHYIWFVYAAIGAAAFLALWVFKFVTMIIDNAAKRR